MRSSNFPKLIIGFLLLGTSTTGLADDSASKGCSVTSELKVRNLGTHRNQGLSGFCYGFTATEALEQYVCKSENSDCSSKSDALSVLDVIKAGERGKIQEGGDTNFVLSAFLYGSQKIAKESCAPFSRLKLNHDRSRIEKLYSDAQELSQAAKKNSSGPTVNICQMPAVKDLISAFHLTDLHEVLTIANESDVRRGLADLLVSDSCRENGIVIPSVHAKHIYTNVALNSDTVRNQLTENSKKNIPTI
jgi:hypothetical protein